VIYGLSDEESQNGGDVASETSILGTMVRLLREEGTKYGFRDNNQRKTAGSRILRNHTNSKKDDLKKTKRFACRGGEIAVVNMKLFCISLETVIVWLLVRGQSFGIYEVKKSNTATLLLLQINAGGDYEIVEPTHPSL